MKDQTSFLSIVKQPVPDIVQHGGRFIFKSGSIPSSLDLKAIPPTMQIGDRFFQIDHIALCLQDIETWQRRIDEMIDCGGILIEGPGIFPLDFCDLAVPNELIMRFASIVIPDSKLTFVLSTSRQPDDQLSQFVQRHGEGIHHVAVHSKDFAVTSAYLRRIRFTPLSEIISDDKLVQQFFINPHGQVLELISRKLSLLGTFSCGNIAQLRLSEKKAA
jgi:hypothetical protein